MDQRRGASGPQFRADRLVEQEAVRTTIVGGRPPGSGQSIGSIPRGIEVLVKKASVDPAFKQLLLAERAAAADRIGLKLDVAEAMMLAAAPAEQLEAVITRTSVPQEQRRAFLGQAAAAMLAVIGVVAAGCGGPPATKGIRPEKPPPPSAGERPDKPPPVPGIRPDEVEPIKGIRPERPAPATDPPTAKTDPP